MAMAAVTTMAAADITTTTSAEARLTVLADNRSSDPARFPPEHGLSILLDTGSLRILLDTGASDLLTGCAHNGLENNLAACPRPSFLRLGDDIDRQEFSPPGLFLYKRKMPRNRD